MIDPPGDWSRAMGSRRKGSSGASRRSMAMEMQAPVLGVMIFALQTIFALSGPHVVLAFRLPWALWIHCHCIFSGSSIKGSRKPHSCSWSWHKRRREHTQGHRLLLLRGPIDIASLWHCLLLSLWHCEWNLEETQRNLERKTGKKLQKSTNVYPYMQPKDQRTRKNYRNAQICTFILCIHACMPTFTYLYRYTYIHCK
jgi:hypothetical protein